MPALQTSQGAYETRDPADPALNHGAPVVKNGNVGIAVKQKAAHWDQGLSSATVIADNEKYFIITQGTVLVDGTFAKDAPLYITAANALTATATGNTKFGKVVEVPGDGRGVPTGKVRVNLDRKDSF